MAKKIDRPFIRVHENMPEHPKVEPLSDKAFRLLVETWCWTKRAKTNGHVNAAIWKRRGTAQARAQLIAAGLVDDDLTGGVIVHDFDEWQMTTDEIDEARDVKSTAGSLGAHVKWHVNRGITDPDCELCQTDGKPMARASEDG